MRIRLLRAFVTIMALAVVWLVASPALAADALVSMHPPEDAVPVSSRAPLCDPRGATTFAPPPQLQDVEISLDSGLTLDDCLSSSSRNVSRAAPGRAPLPLDASASSDSACDRIITAVATLAAARRELVPVPAASRVCPRAGVRSTVDRPPRA